MIEFAGITCSGKSTALQELFESNTESGLVDSEQWLASYYTEQARKLGLSRFSRSGLFKTFLICLAHMRNLYRYRTYYYLCLRQIIGGDRRLLALRSFFFKFGKFLILHSEKERQVLVDEGHIQLLFSLFVRDRDLDETSRQLLLRILDTMPLPDYVVFGPSSPREVFVQRLLARGHHRVTGERHRIRQVQPGQELGAETTLLAEQFVDRSVAVQEIILAALKGRVPLWLIERVDGWDKVVEAYTGEPDMSQFIS